VTQDRVRERIYDERIIVVLRENAAALCVDKARALLAGGLSVMEVTFTTPGAVEAIREIRKKLSGCLVGAGSVTTVKQATSAVAAGATFLVSPVFVKPVAAWAKSRKILYSAGALTPQEIQNAWDAGIRPVKVFPASSLGGPSYIKQLLAPLPHLELCPTGGIHVENFTAYLDVKFST
jgi:2-dehydro-3-deoxyphosphogluconate aldolase/(4S)-4-hydroxy-2-oxoglutarate aldolase